MHASGYFLPARLLVTADRARMESPLAEEPESSYGRRRRSSAAPVRPAGPPAGALAGAPAGAPDASPATRRSNKSGNETADPRPSTGRPAIRRVPPPLVAAKPSTQAAPDAVLSGAQQAVDADRHKGSRRTVASFSLLGSSTFMTSTERARLSALMVTLSLRSATRMGTSVSRRRSTTRCVPSSMTRTTTRQRPCSKCATLTRAATSIFRSSRFSTRC